MTETRQVTGNWAGLLTGQWAKLGTEPWMGYGTNPGSRDWFRDVQGLGTGTD